MTPTQEDAELADFILGRSARLVDMDRITAFRLAAEEAGFRAGLEWGESARIEGVRMALEAAAKVADDAIATWLCVQAKHMTMAEFARLVEAHVQAAERIATAIRQIDPASLGAE